MSLPTPVRQYLERRTLERHKPFCMRVSPGHRLLDYWGNPTDFGLEDMTVDSDVSEAIPLLADYGWEEEVELPFVTDPSQHSYHIHLVPAAEGRYVLLIDARKELEERRRYQQAANEVSLALEKEQKVIAELVDAQAELALRRKEAELESRRRGEYIATMSHEFRTPLTSIIAHAEQLAANPAAATGSEPARAIAQIAHRQIWAIDNLLARAQLDAEGFGVHPGVTDLRRLVDELALVFAPLAAEKALSFAAVVTPAVPEFVWLDGLHLRQVLVNLLGNAVKYTRTGSVKLEVDFDGARLAASVVDTGPGMDEKCLRNIYSPFVRGRQAPDAPGAGLGLGIARQLVTAMNGELALESAVGKGTTLRLDVPAQPVGEADAGPAANPTGTAIVCDDDADICDLLEVRLGEAGFEVVVAPDGESLIRQVGSITPRIVIVDINMPDMNGAVAARRLRESGFTGPIVALSGAARARDIEFALSSGCTEFVRKPPQMTALIRLVQALVLAGDAKPDGPETAIAERKEM